VIFDAALKAQVAQSALQNRSRSRINCLHLAAKLRTLRALHTVADKSQEISRK
jgi:hypothetical protein